MLKNASATGNSPPSCRVADNKVITFSRRSFSYVGSLYGPDVTLFYAFFVCVFKTYGGNVLYFESLPAPVRYSVTHI